MTQQVDEGKQAVNRLATKARLLIVFGAAVVGLALFFAPSKAPNAPQNAAPKAQLK